MRAGRPPDHRDRPADGTRPRAAGRYLAQSASAVSPQSRVSARVLRFGDRLGRRRVLLAALAVALAGAIVAALADDLPTLLVGRVLQGAGGGVFPLSVALVRDQLPPERVATAVAVLSSLLGAGAGLGIAVAGTIVDGLGVRALFWIPAVLLGLGMVAIRAWAPPSPAPGPGDESGSPSRLVDPRVLGAPGVAFGNVVGVLPGKTRPGEAVLYTAHWDHLGRCPADGTGDDICNGAIDNATGTAALVALAEAHRNSRPDRTIVFLAVTAEESGLIG